MNHTRNHYIIGLTALALAVGGTGFGAAKFASIPPAHVSHFAWPGLTDIQQVKLQAALEALPKQDVTIMCADANCSDLAEDLQYVAYQAGWPTHSDRPLFDSNHGLNVAPDDATGRAIAKAIQDSTGIKTGTIKATAATTYSIVISAR